MSGRLRCRKGAPIYKNWFNRTDHRTIASTGKDEVQLCHAFHNPLDRIPLVRDLAGKLGENTAAHRCLSAVVDERF